MPGSNNGSLRTVAGTRRSKYPMWTIWPFCITGTPYCVPASFVAVAILCLNAHTIQAQGQPAPDHQSITVRGQTYTPRSLLA